MKYAILETNQTPKSVTEVRQFLGLAGYYRKFVNDFSNIAKPQTQLTKKRENFVWTEECETAFFRIESWANDCTCSYYSRLVG